MKKLLLSLIVTMVCVNVSYALVDNAAEWEIRATATAGNVNGCAFSSATAGTTGVDGTQQDEAVMFSSDLSLGAGGNSVTSAGGAVFVDSHTGNALHITAGTGFTPGWYMITGVAAGVATLFNSAGTVGSTGGTGRVGGACSLNSTTDDDLWEATAASNTIWIKLGEYSLGESVAISTDALVTLPTETIGYDTVRGELMGTSLPHIDVGANSFTFAGNNFNFRNLAITGTGNNAFSTGQPATLFNVRISNTSSTSGRAASNVSTNSRIFRSEITSTNGIAVSIGNNNSVIIAGTWIHDSNNGVFSSNSVGGEIYFANLFENYSSSAIFYTNNTAPNIYAINNTFVSTHTGNTGTAIYINGVPPASPKDFVLNNIFTNHDIAINKRIGGGVGWDNGIYTRNNFYNNTVNVSSTVNIADRNYFLDPQFTDINTGDFRVGANMQNLAVPYGFGTSKSTSAFDLGAVQTENQTGGAGGVRSFGFAQ